MYKRVFNYCQKGVLSLPIRVSLVDLRAYKAYTLVGPPALRLALDPLAFCSLTTDYISPFFKNFGIRLIIGRKLISVTQKILWKN